jgi:hypothetical protein
MSMFDATQFLNATFNEANATSLPPVSAGEHIVLIDAAPEFKTFAITRGDRAGQDLNKVSFPLRVVAPGQADDGRQLRFDAILDLTPQGGLDFSKDKNISLGRIRTACGLNVAGQPFGFGMFVGKQLRAVVTHEVDGRDGETIHSRVNRVAAM